MMAPQAWHSDCVARPISVQLDADRIHALTVDEARDLRRQLWQALVKVQRELDDNQQAGEQ